MKINILKTEVNISTGVVFSAAALCLLLCCVSGYVINARAKPVIVSSHQNSDTANTQGARQSATTKQGTNTQAASPQDEEIKVYVIGCVNNPGIVTIKKGQLIDDAINAAGGATVDADLYNINMVYKLKENVMLIIKPQYQAGEALSEQTPSPAGNGVTIVSDSGGAIFEPAEGSAPNRKINLNLASLNELDTLPGIGKESAKDIIEYREKNGGFKAIEDIMKVRGIKESRFGSIKDLISID